MTIIRKQGLPPLPPFKTALTVFEHHQHNLPPNVCCTQVLAENWCHCGASNDKSITEEGKPVDLVKEPNRVHASSSRTKCQLERGSQLLASIHFTFAGLGLCFEPGMSPQQLVHEVRHFSGHRQHLIAAGWIVHGGWYIISWINEDLSYAIISTLN